MTGPENAFSGQQVAGTILDGGYPNNSNTRFISPTIALPNLISEETIQLKSWHWYILSEFDVKDVGNIQISVDGGEWETVSTQNFDGASPVWTQNVTDLSNYAGLSVRIAFYFTSGVNFGETGWYVDDILIEKKVVSINNPETFELGVGDWSAENGQWQVGQATVGPNAAHLGDNVAGTVLDGGYPNNANSRFISPPVVLPTITAGEEIKLKSWHWYILSEFDVKDVGNIQISVDGGEWQTISTQNFDGTSTVWTQNIIDLTEYAGQSVRIAFYFSSGVNFGQTGWYIDDILIEKI